MMGTAEGPTGRASSPTRRMGRAAMPSKPRAGDGTGEPGGGVGAGEHEGEGDGPPPLTAADFQIDVTGEQATVCPAGHPSIEEYELKDAPERVEVHFAGTTCEPCPLRSRCPVKLDRRAGAYVLKADLVKVNIERRRRAEATEEWCKRYDIWYRGNELRAEARPRAWALAGARGPSGAACRLPDWRATSSGWSMHAWWRWRTRLSGRSGRYLRSRPHEGAAPQLPPGALSHGRGTAKGSRLS